MARNLDIPYDSWYWILSFVFLSALINFRPTIPLKIRPNSPAIASNECLLLNLYPCFGQSRCDFSPVCVKSLIEVQREPYRRFLRDSISGCFCAREP